MTLPSDRRLFSNPANSNHQRRTNMANQKPNFLAYTIVETNNEANDFWQRIGSAWNNADGSINITLNALPVNGKLHIRAPKTDEASER